jgi:hypothetical protein
MAIVVEDGTIVSGANSYVTEAELTTFATERGITITGTNSELIYQSMDYIEQQNFIGVKSTQAQPLQWPRYDAYVDSYLIASNTIPQDLKNAQMQTALSIDEGNGPLDVVEQKVKREKVDVLETEYSDNSSQTYDPKISNYLKKLTKGGGAFRAVKA